LDFTVIGPDVNLTSRIERLCRELDRNLIMSEDSVRYLDSPMFEIGHFRLRGFSRMQLLFGLPDADAGAQRRSQSGNDARRGGNFRCQLGDVPRLRQRKSSRQAARVWLWWCAYRVNRAYPYVITDSARAPSSALGNDIYSPQPRRPTGRGHKHKYP